MEFLDEINGQHFLCTNVPEPFCDKKVTYNLSCDLTIHGIYNLAGEKLVKQFK